MPFQRPTLPILIARAKNDLNSRLSGTDAALRRANTNALAYMHAGATHGMYGYLDWKTAQIIFDTAESEYLERWASFWGIFRKAAAFASGTVSFTGTSGVTITEGTELQLSDNAIYTLDADVTLASGTGSGTVTASVAGKDGNTDAATILSFINAIEGVATSATIGADGLTNGVDQETDPYLLYRFLRRLQKAPQGGADFDYEDWAMSIAGVTRAWCYRKHLGIGTVGVTFVCDNQNDTVIPDNSLVTTVANYIETVRPVTADVTVFAPVAVTLNPIIAISPSTTAVKSAITAALADLIRREAIPGGVTETDQDSGETIIGGKMLLSHIKEAISVSSGEWDNELSYPSGNIILTTGQILTLGIITWETL